MATLAALGNDLPVGLVYTRDHYKGENNFGLITLHRQFDERKFARSENDVAHVFKNSVPALRKVPDAGAKLAMDGAIWFRDAVEGVLTLKGDDAYSPFADERYHAFLIWMGNMLTTRTQESFATKRCRPPPRRIQPSPRRGAGVLRAGGRGGDDKEEKSNPAQWLHGLKGRNKPHGHVIGHIIAVWNAFIVGRPLERIAIDKRNSPGILEVE